MLVGGGYQGVGNFEFEETPVATGKRRRNSITRLIEDVVDDAKDLVDDVVDRAKDVEHDGRKAVRRAYFPEARGYLECPIYDRYALPPGIGLTGPAIVEERESTTVLPPGVEAVVDEYANLVVQVTS